MAPDFFGSGGGQAVPLQSLSNPASGNCLTPPPIVSMGGSKGKLHHPRYSQCGSCAELVLGPLPAPTHTQQGCFESYATPPPQFVCSPEGGRSGGNEGGPERAMKGEGGEVTAAQEAPGPSEKHQLSLLPGHLPVRRRGSAGPRLESSPSPGSPCPRAGVRRSRT